VAIIREPMNIGMRRSEKISVIPSEKMVIGVLAPMKCAILQADWLRDDFCTGIFLEPLHFVHKAKVETGTVEKVKGQGFARFEGLMWRSEFES